LNGHALIQFAYQASSSFQLEAAKSFMFFASMDGMEIINQRELFCAKSFRGDWLK